MSSLQAAARHVESRAMFCRSRVPDWPLERHLALAALEFTVGHVSAPEYAVRRASGFLVGTDPDVILKHEAGICGHASIVLCAILRKVGVRSRRVQVFSPVVGHVVVEAFWEGGWRYLDPTWGTFYVRDGELLEFGEVLALGGERGLFEVTFGSQYWRLVTELVVGGREGTGLSVLDDAVYAVVVGGDVVFDVREVLVV